jgi:transposase
MSSLRKKLSIQSADQGARLWIGIDISKDHLELASKELALPARIPNSAKGIAQLIGRLKPLPEKVQVCCEATGGYEKRLRKALQKHQIAFSLVMPRRVRCFAEACGLLAKTDKIDSRLLLEYGRRMEPVPTAPTEPVLEQLAERLHFRQQLLDQTVALQNFSHQCDDPWSRRHIQGLLKQMRAQLCQVSLALEQLAASLPGLSQKIECLVQTKGVGFLTALSLLVTVPELAQLSKAQAAALVGELLPTTAIAVWEARNAAPWAEELLPVRPSTWRL